jgi:hypothetical protein
MYGGKLRKQLFKEYDEGGFALALEEACIV